MEFTREPTSLDLIFRLLITLWLVQNILLFYNMYLQGEGLDIEVSEAFSADEILVYLSFYLDLAFFAIMFFFSLFLLFQGRYSVVGTSMMAGGSVLFLLGSIAWRSLPDIGLIPDNSITQMLRDLVVSGEPSTNELDAFLDPLWESFLVSNFGLLLFAIGMAFLLDKLVLTKIMLVFYGLANLGFTIFIFIIFVKVLASIVTLGIGLPFVIAKSTPLKVKGF